MKLSDHLQRGNRLDVVRVASVCVIAAFCDLDNLAEVAAQGCKPRERRAKGGVERQRNIGLDRKPVSARRHDVDIPASRTRHWRGTGYRSFVGFNRVIHGSLQGSKVRSQPVPQFGCSVEIMKSSELWLTAYDTNSFGTARHVCDTLAAAVPEFTIEQPENKYQRLAEFRRAGGRIDSPLGNVVRDWPKEFRCFVKSADYVIEVFVQDDEEVPGFCAFADPEEHAQVQEILNRIEEVFQFEFSGRQIGTNTEQDTDGKAPPAIV